MGYHAVVKNSFNDGTIVEHNEGNAEHTGTGLKNIQRWLKGEHWDVIHFNGGLWDLCYRHPDAVTYGNRDKITGKVQSTPEEYKANLHALVAILKTTGAKLIFATTTMVPPGEPGRFAGDEKIYNNIAVGVMKEQEVEMNDLNGISYNNHEQVGLSDAAVHYQPGGYKMLALSVTASIKKMLTIY